MLRAEATEDEHQTVARLSSFHQPLEIHQDVGFGWNLCWRNLVATVAVDQQPDAIIIQQQGLPQHGVHVPRIIHGTLQSCMRACVVYANNESLPPNIGSQRLAHDVRQRCRLDPSKLLLFHHLRHLHLWFLVQPTVALLQVSKMCLNGTLHLGCRAAIRHHCFHPGPGKGSLYHSFNRKFCTPLSLLARGKASQGAVEAGGLHGSRPCQRNTGKYQSSGSWMETNRQVLLQTREGGGLHLSPLENGRLGLGS
mmetsp:Transcript_75845/g.120157  ORF Transcript_75845/g.120157 Transcript_75845/m.120157 type:complete len:252 (+) Transcript_75845:775-1530(+)